ncbi:MAG: FGGY-family carbohydrate kinase [Gaiellaceae bacterium]
MGSSVTDGYVLGIDAGTESVRAGIFDLSGTPVAIEVEPYGVAQPRSGWAEQDPADWWRALRGAVRAAVASAGDRADAILGLSVAATSCTVVATDADGSPLRPSIIWMDVRAGEEARRIAETGHPALKYTGHGPVSAEWLPCKALWLKRHEPEVYDAAAHFCEYTDWLIHRLTGEWTASIDNTSIRWFYDRDEGGLPISLYEEVGLDDLPAKLPSRVLDMGAVAGSLTAEAAAELGLPAGLPVAEGGADAFVAMAGLDVLAPGRLALITGSSHLMLMQVAAPVYGKGFFGAYTDAVLPGTYTLEGGQTSTGSVVRWFVDRFAGGATYDELTGRAAGLPPGSDGIVVVSDWQGNRTPYVDPDARGVIWGLSLAHDVHHLFRGILEGVCFGSENVLRAFRDQGVEVGHAVACGGPSRSRFWMQMHADVSDLRIERTRVPEVVALGAAVLAAVGAGAYADVPAAARAMVSSLDVIEPDAGRHEEYAFYCDQAIATYHGLKDQMHAVARRQAAGAAVAAGGD